MEEDKKEQINVLKLKQINKLIDITDDLIKDDFNLNTMREIRENVVVIIQLLNQLEMEKKNYERKIN